MVIFKLQKRKKWSYNIWITLLQTYVNTLLILLIGYHSTSYQDLNGEFATYKAMLIARGFLQKPCTDFNEVYALQSLKQLE